VAPPEVPVPLVPVEPVVLSDDGLPVVLGPEPLGPVPLPVVVAGDALPRGLTSGLEAVLREDVHAVAAAMNSARAERPAISDFIDASCDKW
jgi:hypothetical protein